jgi:hypothetical protein
MPNIGRKPAVADLWKLVRVLRKKYSRSPITHVFHKEPDTVLFSGLAELP